MLAAAWLALPVQASGHGAELFGQYCAVCHGDHGTGGVGVPLALPSFQASVSNAYLKKTIRHGRPGRVMPAFTTLSDEDIDAIVGFIRSWNEGPQPTFDPAPIQGDVTHGQALFAQHCAACHGANGEGGKGTGVTMSRPRDLPIIAPALNNAGFLAAARDAMIKATLEKGREGTPMVSFRKQGLSDTDLNDLVAYIRSFESHTPQAAPAPLESSLVYESPYSLEDTVAAVVQAAVGKNFRIIRKQYLEEGFFPEDQVDHRQVIVYFCNFNFLYKAMALDPRVGLFLPCRVTVVEDKDGNVKVYAVNPKQLSVLFNNNALDEACETMYKLYTDILEEATL